MATEDVRRRTVSLSQEAELRAIARAELRTTAELELRVIAAEAGRLSGGSEFDNRKVVYYIGI